MNDQTAFPALIAFVTARVNEDEAAAKWASKGPWTLRGGGYVVGGPDDRDGSPAVTVAAQTQQWNGEHIARHDPARALREVEAKRRTIEAAVAAWNATADPDDTYWVGLAPTLKALVKNLAAIWCDHPEFRAEWKPS